MISSHLNSVTKLCDCNYMSTLVLEKHI